ncbi:patatin-like phospholipase family protein [Deminuibacter soli]|uniref:Patatin-like phospholipase family protein n=1 Tax=Deminuibacter soli TaxID=2291815 RepID=A0A3E1NR46_9BACT|nr:patatin-like phospholipase family protein [Deminuibacter soli]RFM30429.1 patatin-like phospholipase family protein [Deminuibacter soli]
MKKYLIGFYYSLPIQLFLLHFRRYQIFLIFWYVLFATIAGDFMQNFGAYALYLSPEYLGSVNSISTSIVGFSIGAFIMSWNITTFILHSKHIRFLATTAQPFLKYCINNGIIPVAFLIFYFYKAVEHNHYRDLLGARDIFFLAAGFTSGFVLALLIAFLYFFGADKTIYHRMASIITTANKHYVEALKLNPLPVDKREKEIRVDFFLSAKLGLRVPRDVRHYAPEFLDVIFKRHHFAAVIAIFIAFLFLITIGFFLDNPVFQVPAAASITIFFAILIAVAGAFTLFCHSWSLPILVVIYLSVNWMYEHDIIDLRNKAYGLAYNQKEGRPEYSRATIDGMASPEFAEADKKAFLRRLENWKARQGPGKPVMFLINVSGGGSRSAYFTMNVLQRLDSLTNGRIMPQTVLMTGASGGMLGAAYFRELYWLKQRGAPIHLQDERFRNDIARDLLNPLFSSFISRDLVGPAKKFQIGNKSYVKDRGYAFERALRENTHGLLDKTIGDYTLAEDSAFIPTMFFSATISRDGRKVLMGSRPARFLMRSVRTGYRVFPESDPDAIDFASLFAGQDAMKLQVSSALRMNATFPYVLPNVWLPTNPVIDVMDAGLRDNFGQETALRYLRVFQDWAKANCRRVVMIEIRDRPIGEWEKPGDNSMVSFLTKPFLLLQNNWFKLQDYYQTDQLNYLSETMGPQFYRLCFQYVAGEHDNYASLSFHLNASEKKGIAMALNNDGNRLTFNILQQLMK